MALVLEVETRLDRAAEGVLGGEERDEFHARGAVQDVDGRRAVAVDAGGMGEEADGFSAHGGEAVGGQHVDAEHDGLGDDGGRLRRAGGAGGRRGRDRRDRRDQHGGGRGAVAGAAQQAEKKEREADERTGGAEQGGG